MIRILFLAANPSDNTRLRLDEESRAIDETLRFAEFRGFDVKMHFAVRVTDVQALLLRHKPHIVHFSGHGSSDGEIILKNDFGASHPVSARALSQLFAALKDDVQCVILNACYSEVQAKAIADHIACVIGMPEAIRDEASISFATAFYQALGYGKSVQTAFELGCSQIHLENSEEQANPKLLAINANASEIFFPRRRDDTVPTPPVKWWKREVVHRTVAAIGIIAIIMTIVSFVVQSCLSLPLEYTGRITDSTTKDPIASAKVALEFQGAPPIVYTDDEGFFRFNLSFNGSRLPGRVRVDAPGYKVYTRWIELSSTETSIEDIRLTRLVITPTDAPVPTNLPKSTATDVPPTVVPTVTSTVDSTATPTITTTITMTPLSPGACSSTLPSLVITSTVDQAPMVCIPAGKFTRGNNNGNDDEQPEAQIELAEFYIDRFEVTNRLYRQCVAANPGEEKCTDPKEPSTDYLDNDYPVVGVTWEQAKQYCEFRGKRLPTEAEWEKAARGTQGYIYPWGNKPESIQTIFKGRGSTVQIKSTPEDKSDYDVYNMAGNVREWVNDRYDPMYYENQQSNPQGPENGSRRVVRGGSWSRGLEEEDAHFWSATKREALDPGSSSDDLGFRCAADKAPVSLVDENLPRESSEFTTKGAVEQ